jgi:hypothetical protein
MRADARDRTTESHNHDSRAGRLTDRATRAGARPVRRYHAEQGRVERRSGEPRRRNLSQAKPLRVTARRGSRTPISRDLRSLTPTHESESSAAETAQTGQNAWSSVQASVFDSALTNSGYSDFSRIAADGDFKLDRLRNRPRSNLVDCAIDMGRGRRRRAGGGLAGAGLSECGDTVC